MSARLVFLSGSRSGHQIELGDIPVTLGRSPECTVVYPSGRVVVSAHHATVKPGADGWVIVDEDSRNGTFVNKRRINDGLLASGDVIELGPGGPSLQFSSTSASELTPTLEFAANTLSDIYRVARARTDANDTGRFERPLQLSREFVAIAYKKSSRRTRLMLGALAVVLVVSVGLLVRLNLETRARLQASLDEMAVALAAESNTRSGLARDLAALEGVNDSLQAALREAAAAPVSNDAPAEALAARVTREFSAGVALIVYSYGFSDRSSGRMLRYQTDGLGRVVRSVSRSGDTIPRVTLGGDGPLVERQGSATGFLIDGDGWIVTNRHVAQPWLEDEDLEQMIRDGLPMEPVMTALRAHFPPGSSEHSLVVDTISADQDLALLRSLNPGIDAPVLQLAPRGLTVDPGDAVVLIGYPTGVHNLMFRVSGPERAGIAKDVGEPSDPIRLASALAARGLIQPLVTSGNVADTTVSEIIHSAESTGGSSGGPVIDDSRHVVAIHYAYVSSPVTGDPFRTQRAVRVDYLWDLLPAALREKLEH